MSQKPSTAIIGSVVVECKAEEHIRTSIRSIGGSRQFKEEGGDVVRFGDTALNLNH
jgi:hypothetical protein